MSTNELNSSVPAAATTSQTSPDRLTLIAFATFILFGGAAPIAVRFIYDEMAPFWSGVVRFGVAALIFWALLLIRRVPLPRGQALLGAVLFGVLSFGLSFLLIYYGLIKTPTSLFQITAAIVPILTIFFAAAHRLEPLRKRGVAGGIIAALGIAIAVSGSLFSGVEVSLPHILAIVASSACFAEAGIVIKLFPPSHPFATNAVAMTVGALIMLVASLITGEMWSLPSSTSTWLALIFLILGATVVGFLLYLFALERWTASGVSYSFVLYPIVTVVLAAILIDETITLLFLGGAAVVLTGVTVGALLPQNKPG
jgi:drug/metabolite transporter (DMT)-like permease